MDVNGKVVLITGASSGIGLALARLLTGRGARTALAARSQDKLTELSRELSGSLAVPADVRDDASVRRMVQATQEHYGRIDILVNNAGRGMHTSIEAASLEDYRDLLDLNVVGPLNAMQCVVPLMRSHGGGVIINVSSGTTMRVIEGLGPYSSTKHALNNLTLVARAELAGDNIRVGLVYPWVTDTAFAAGAGRGSRPAAGSGLEPDTAAYAAGLVLAAIESEHAETYAAKVAGMMNRPAL